MQQETSEHEIVQKARLVGQLEGRAEAAVEIAELRGEISDLLKRIEEMMVVSRNDQVNEVLVKKMMSILYEALKKEFQTSETTVSRCKNCIRSTTTQLIQQFCPDASERNFRKKKMTRPASQPSIETKSPRESSPERMWTLKKRIGSTKRIVSRERAHETYQIRILNATKVGIGRRAHMVYAINNTLVEPVSCFESFSCALIDCIIESRDQTPIPRVRMARGYVSSCFSIFLCAFAAIERKLSS